MTIRQSLTSSFLLDAMTGVGHDLAADTLKLAFYDDTAALNYLTGAYSASHEITGTGYSAGGFTLTPTATYPKLSATGRPLMDFADFVASPANFIVYQGLIYNVSKANRSIAVLDFPGGLVVTTSLSWVWPPATDDAAIIRASAAR